MSLSKVLLDGDFVDTALMAATLIGGRQEGLDHGDGLFVGDKAPRHGKDVGIVVLAGKTGNCQAPAQCRANALMLVQRDIDAFTAATDGDTGIALALLNCQSTRMGKIGIVTTVLIIGTEVLAGDTLPLKPTLDSLLDGLAGMVATQGDRNARFQD